MTEPVIPFIDVAIAKANEAAVLKLIADEAARLEALKDAARATARARGMSELEVDALFPPYPAGAIGLP
jgi:hypothetical protein